MRAMIDALVARDTDPQQADAQIGTLVADYGAAEVERMLDRITRQFQRPRDPDAQEAWLYAEYVKLHPPPQQRRRDNVGRSHIPASRLEEHLLPPMCCQIVQSGQVSQGFVSAMRGRTTTAICARRGDAPAG